MGNKLDFNAPRISRAFVPVYSNASYHQRRKSPVPSPSLWEHYLAWVRYHSIQLRWDIERALSRLLHRRWSK